jgi:hypothetical protein
MEYSGRDMFRSARSEEENARKIFSSQSAVARLLRPLHLFVGIMDGSVGSDEYGMPTCRIAVVLEYSLWYKVCTLEKCWNHGIPPHILSDAVDRNVFLCRGNSRPPKSFPRPP